MMQIHIDAITASRNGEPQYVLKKSLDMLRTSDKRKVVGFLNEGYTVVSKYRNGIDDAIYCIKNVNDIALIKDVVEDMVWKELQTPDSITIGMLEYFDEYCVSEGMKAYVCFVYRNEAKKRTFDRFDFKNAQAARLREVIVANNIKQDDAFLKNILERGIFK